MDSMASQAGPVVRHERRHLETGVAVERLRELSLRVWPDRSASNSVEHDPDVGARDDVPQVADAADQALYADGIGGADGDDHVRALQRHQRCAVTARRRGIEGDLLVPLQGEAAVDHGER